jgi:hypothetical protein
VHFDERGPRCSTPAFATRSRVIVCVCNGGEIRQDNHPVYPHRYPTRACWLRAVQLVRSLADNVLNRVHRWQQRRTPPEAPSGKGLGLDNMVRVVEGPHASSNATRPTGAIRSKACFSVFACVARLQASNVPARDRRAAGVQVPPKLSVNAITWNVERPSVRHTHVWQADRKAGPWRDGIEKSEEAKAALQ